MINKGQDNAIFSANRCRYHSGFTIPTADWPVSLFTTSAVNAVSDFAASFEHAITDPWNFVSGTDNSKNIAEMLTLQAISNNFLLQIGSVSGRLNHKQYSLPSTFIDMSSQAVGTYYLYLVDQGTNGIQFEVDTAQRPESNTCMYFGKFDRTATGFANQSSISELVRFGTARLLKDSSGQKMLGSQIRVGPYVG